MTPEDLCYGSLIDTAALLRRGVLSPVELTQAVLARIAALDDRLHSYITVLAKSALARARTAEAEIAAGDYRGPLHGIPIGVKDLCATKGVRTTCASRVLQDWIPDYDATVVKRLDRAGAIMIGKLNMTEFALSGYHPSLPIPCNPWDLAAHAGVSSSGSGVAVAAGLCFGAIGTDTGGSIRGPSAWNGVVGLKPTYGRVSRHGVFPLAMSLDHLGPITRGVADAAALYTVLAGHDPADPTSLREPAAISIEALQRSIAGIRIGYDEAYSSGGAMPELVAAVEQVGRVLQAAGAALVAVRLPPVDEVLEAWFPLCAVEALVAHRDFYPARADQYGRMFRSLLEYGAGCSAADYVVANEQRLQFAGALQSIFDEADVLLCPGSFATAPPATLIDPDGEFTPDLARFMRYSSPFNYSGNPTLSLTCGFSPAGLPYGAQLVGRRLEEQLLLTVGTSYERATSWKTRRPLLRIDD